MEQLFVHRLHQLAPSKTKTVAKKAPASSFQTIFKHELGIASPLKISKHAKERMIDRHIQIEPMKWQEIAQKVSEAKQKGITDSLVLTKDAALIVSAKNDTVITAMNRNEAREQIFTNINGTIILD